MKYAALSLQVLSACVVIIAIAMHFTVLSYDPNRVSERGIETLFTGMSGLAVMSFASVLAVVGVLGVATRCGGFFRTVSISSITLGVATTVTFLATRIVLLGL